MRYLFIFLIFTISCKPDAPEKESAVEVIDYTSMNLNSPAMTLVGSAQQYALNWKEYQDLITAFENYDHSIAATNILITHVDKMLQEPDAKFNQQSILSRIKVLKTRLGIYKSYLNYRVKTNSSIEEKYNSIILALNELTDQMNWRINEFDSENRKLLEDLKADIDPETAE